VARRFRTLQDVIDTLPPFGARRAIGRHSDLGIRWWSYARLHAAVWQVAAMLASRGVGKGDRVGLWAPNSPEWVAAFFGIALRGGVAVLIDAETGPDAAAAIAAAERCTVVFAPAAARGLFVHSFVIAIEAVEAGDTGGASGDRADRTRVSVSDDDPVALLFSSGTTAAPKGVMLSHGNMACQVAPFLAWRHVLRWVPVRMLALPPSTHVLGLVVGTVLPLAIGLTVVSTSGAHAALWTRVIRDYRITIVLAVPRVLQVLARHLRAARLGRTQRSLAERIDGRGAVVRAACAVWARGAMFGRPWFRMFFVGGAHLPPETARFWRRTGLLVVQGYGLAETSAIVSVSNPFAFDVGDVGRPDRFRGIALAPDGEILVGGPHLALSARGAVGEDGRLPTGDLGRLDRRGRLVILGRKKDVIVTADGFNVHPDDVEAVLGGTPGVADAAVVSRTAGAGEEVHAVVKVHPGADVAEVVRQANARLDPSQRIHSWTSWPDTRALPRNAMGKILRAEVSAHLARHASSSPVETRGTVTADDVLRESDRARRVRMVARLVTDRAVPGTVSALRLDRDLGLSSLDVVEMLALVEQQDVPTTLPILAPDATIGDVRTQVRERAASRRYPPAGPSRWAWPLRVIRPVARMIAVQYWSLAGTRVHASWEVDPATWRGPLVLAAAPHRHWLDAFVVQLALPWRLGRREHLLVEHDFAEHFRPDPGAPLRSRLRIAFAYYFGLPVLFPFTLLQPHGRTRDGLLDAAKRIDRGAVLLTFPKGLAYWGNPQPDRHALGVERLALETGCDIVPVHLGTQGRALDGRWRRPRQTIVVRFGQPIAARPDQSADELAAAVEAAFRRLRDQDQESPSSR
jgi:long-chain acyl-CoA synthetase